VDEVMCKTLKPHSSGTWFNDVVMIKGCDLYFASNEGSNLRMMRVWAETGTNENVVTGDLSPRRMPIIFPNSRNRTTPTSTLA
jgi:hypothetical protein